MSEEHLACTIGRDVSRPTFVQDSAKISCSSARAAQNCGEPDDAG